MKRTCIGVDVGPVNNAIVITEVTRTPGGSLVKVERKFLYSLTDEGKPSDTSTFYESALHLCEEIGPCLFGSLVAIERQTKNRKFVLIFECYAITQILYTLFRERGAEVILVDPQTMKAFFGINGNKAQKKRKALLRAKEILETNNLSQHVADAFLILLYTIAQNGAYMVVHKS